LTYFNGLIGGLRSTANIDFVCDESAINPTLKFVSREFFNHRFTFNFQMTGKDACIGHDGKWTPINRDFELNNNGGVMGVDFSVFAKRIRGKVSCSGQCDVYLLTSKDYLNV
jgi:hypothetical protein